MRRTSSLILFLFTLLLAGCPLQVYDDLVENYPPTGSTSGSTSGSTTEMPTPTTTDAVTTGPGVQTVTGENEDSGDTTAADPSTTTTTGPQENAPPTIDLFTVTASPPNPPNHLGEAGQAEINLVVSADVVKVHLSLDGVKLADLVPANFPYPWEALSAKDNGPARKFKVVAWDAEGLTAEDEATLSVNCRPRASRSASSRTRTRAP